jgi:hypothetical protein
MPATTRSTMLRLWNSVINNQYSNTQIVATAESDGVCIYAFGRDAYLRIPYDEWEDLVRFVKEEIGEEDAKADS